MNLPLRNLSFYALALLVQTSMYKVTGMLNATPFQVQRNLELPLIIDTLVPFIPETIWMYCLYYLILVSGFFLAFDKKVFPLFFKSFILMSLIADLLFVLIPVSIPLQLVPFTNTGSPSYQLLDLIISIDTRSNCFPSLHCAHSFLIAYWFYKSEKFPQFVSVILMLMTSVVVVATLSVKQHWFLDIVGAAVLFIMLMRVYEKKLQDQRI